MASVKFGEVDGAAILGCNVKAFRARMTALGYTQACGRCGGLGRYSFNPTDGDICFGCRGSRKVLLPITRALVEAAKARIDAGELLPYFAQIQARREARRRIEPLAAKVIALYEPIASAYDAEYKAVFAAANLDLVNGGRVREFDAFLAAVQALANAVRWGTNAATLPLMGAQDIVQAIRAVFDARQQPAGTEGA